MTTQTPPAPAPAPAVSPMSSAGAGPSAYQSGDLVRIDGRPQPVEVDDAPQPLVRVAPASPRTGRIVHPERLTRVEATS